MIEKLRKNLVFSFLLTAVVFFAIAVYADFNSVINSFIKFNWLLLPVLLFLSLGNYVVRFIKWEYYLRLLSIKISLDKSIKIFFSGLSMSASPGKMGEVLKSFLLKEILNEPISKTASIIFAERLTDFLSLTFLAITGIYFFNYSAIWVYLVLIFFVMLIIAISNRKIAGSVIGVLNKFSYLKSHSSKIINLYESAYILLQPKPLLRMILLSTFSWFFECFAFYLILINFDVSVTILFPTFVYALSTIAGAVSMLPGGLGVTEGSLSLILISRGIAKETAVAATFIIRVVTLWFAVILGSAVLFIFQRQYKNSLINKQI
ncbi:MAG: lysylphosphatidylglycerol synthase transmembrane domain-containing protein [Melioribacteraceae bacterium]|nr:lysylphosphatidylglycerol synthase transmembrane domain-containing protein [Melioribacteraceae bacterium]